MRSMLLLGLGCGLGLTVSLHADARSEFLQAAADQKAQHWADAAQGYARVTALAPTYAPAWKQLASCRFYLDDLEGAEASAQRYLKLNPGDASFLAWDGQLRHKLKLAPLDLSTPVPTLIPTAPPVDGAITAAPAPSADAEVVAAEGPAPTVQPAAAAAATKGEATWGLRLAGSFSLGLGAFAHGEQVTSSTAPSGKAYPGQAGMGLGGLAELLYSWGSPWELSLGLYPIDWQETQSSSRTEAVTRSNESSAKSLLLPILANAGARFPLSPTISAVLSAGLGVIPSAHVDVVDATVQTATNSSINTRSQASLDYGLAPAWRLAAGMEVPVTKQASIYVGSQLLGAQFPAVTASYTYQDIDQSGAVLASGSGTTSKAQGLSVLSASALVGLSARF